jgi:hypothetical protein
MQVEHALALVLVDRVVALPQRLRLGDRLPVRREDEAAVRRQIRGIDVVVRRRARDGRKLPPDRPPDVMSYSQMFQRPVQAGTPPTDEVLLVGQRIANTIFRPSYDTSGSDTSPLPCVMGAVTLNSRALGEDFSRTIRSPPGANGAPLVGFTLSVVDRFA